MVLWNKDDSFFQMDEVKFKCFFNGSAAAAAAAAAAAGIAAQTVKCSINYLLGREFFYPQIQQYKDDHFWTSLSSFVLWLFIFSIKIAQLTFEVKALIHFILR